MRALIRGAAATRPFDGVIRLLERLPSADGRLAVLTYHRIGDPDARDGLYPGLISATPAAFAAQMEHIVSCHHLVSAQELLAARDGGLRLPPRSLLVTFDDAYRDFLDLAWPVLQRLSIPVVLFVPTAYPDSGREFWWDRLYRFVERLERPAVLQSPRGRVTVRDAEATSVTFRRLVTIAKALPHEVAMGWLEELLARDDAASAPRPAVLGWSELRVLASQGVTLAPHSRTHPRLDRIETDDIRREVAESRNDLEQAIGMASPPIFAYPDGGQDERVVDAVAGAGYRVAFTTRRGQNTTDRADWLRLRRINVGQRTPLSLIRAQLLAAPDLRQRRHGVAVVGRRIDA